MKKAIKISSIVLTAFWIAVLVISLMAAFTYNDPAAEPLDNFMTVGVYKVFVFTAAIGVFNSALASMSTYSVFPSDTSQISTLKKVTLCVSSITNLLFYLSVYLLFTVNNDTAVIIPTIIWALCATVCTTLLIILRTSKAQ